jgi:hypothetical protein
LTGNAPPVWAQSQLVTVSLGRFSVRLGPVGTPIGNLPMPDLKTVFNGKNRYLGITMNAGATPYGEISPRLAFLTAPYAITAHQATEATTAATALVAQKVTATADSSFTNITLGNGIATTLLKAPKIEATVEVKAPSFNGSGAALTDLNAAKVTTGVLSDDRLSTNIPRKNGTNIFTGANTFSGQNSFSGDGTGLTISGTKVTTGTIADARLSSKVLVGSMKDKPFLLRAEADGYHGLVYGNSAESLSVTGATGSSVISSMWGNLDGPVLTGNAAGALGNVYLENGVPHGSKALGWSRTQVLVYKKLNLQDDLAFNRNGNMGATWTLSQTADFNGTNKGEEMRLTCSTTSGAWFYFQANGQSRWSSDLRLKKDISNLPPILDSVLKLRPVKYRLKERPETEMPVIGFIAQEVKPLFPESVGFDGSYYSLAYSDFGVYAIRAIQELAAESRAQAVDAEARIKALEEENKSLRQDLSDLDRRLNALEAR